ncbi:MAG: hypothetical protein GF315_03485 [candidate division Zixibacteria bacterium]|nr:hypothetical protein [candidate division Zixibacteria bacterium]
MEKKEHLKNSLNTNVAMIKAMIDDITEEESLHRGNGEFNHIKWQTGHLVYTAALTLKCLGEDADLSPEWKDLFARGAGFKEDENIYPSMNEIKAKLYSIHKAIFEKLENMIGSDLEAMVKLGPEYEVTAIDGALFFCAHDAYHCGQMAMIRKALGRERAFG